jgi:hypothetical protein
MKKVLLLLSIVIISLTGFTQSNTGINLCGIKESKPYITIVTMSQLIECGELSANNENLTVVSFSIGMAVGDDFRKIQVTGNKFTKKVVAEIKKYKANKFYIEHIKLSSKKGTIQKVGAHTIILKK